MSRETTCEHCGRRFDVGETCGAFDGSTALYRCPHCSRATRGPSPDGR